MYEKWLFVFKIWFYNLYRFYSGQVWEFLSEEVKGGS